MTTDSKMLAASPGLKAVLGPYALVAEIGRGGMTSAFLALLPNGGGTSRKLVLKQLRSEFSLQNGFGAMLENEALLGTRFRHANVVETYDIYAAHDLSVLIMEFLEGQTLASVRQRAIQKGGYVPFAIHLRVLADTLAGLHYVHELEDERKPLGIVHRNVTPSNVFVTYGGRVKLIDFAIASSMLRDVEKPMSSIIKGSIGYMSPEAVRREPVDRRTDIFSVGVMLWEAATGRRLWQGHDEIAVFRRLTEGDLPIQTLHAEGTSAEMLRIAARALAVDPMHRYATAQEMQLEIERVLARLGGAAHLATLADYMQTCFSVDREQLRTIVDEAEAALLSSPPISQVTTSPLASTGSFRTTSTSYDIVETMPEAPRARRHVQRALGVAGLTAIAATGIALAAHAPSDATAQSAGANVAVQPSVPISSAAPPRALPAPEPTSAPAPAFGTISAVFLVHPSHARLFLDGVPLEGNPAGVRRRPDDKPHLLRVEAPGYATLVRAVDLDRDVAKEFELVPDAAGLAAPRAAASIEPHDELPKVQPVKRAAVHDDPWGI